MPLLAETLDIPMSPKFKREYGKVSIKVSVKPTNDNKVLLKFWNDGPNIEPKIIDSLFNKFSKGYKGEFGLGLVIVYKIINLHDAAIWAINEKKECLFK